MTLLAADLLDVAIGGFFFLLMVGGIVNRLFVRANEKRLREGRPLLGERREDEEDER